MKGYTIIFKEENFHRAISVQNKLKQMENCRFNETVHWWCAKLWISQRKTRIIYRRQAVVWNLSWDVKKLINEWLWKNGNSADAKQPVRYWTWIPPTNWSYSNSEDLLLQSVRNYRVSTHLIRNVSRAIG